MASSSGARRHELSLIICSLDSKETRGTQVLFQRIQRWPPSGEGLFSILEGGRGYLRCVLTWGIDQSYVVPSIQSALLYQSGSHPLSPFVQLDTGGSAGDRALGGNQVHQCADKCRQMPALELCLQDNLSPR